MFWSNFARSTTSSVYNLCVMLFTSLTHKTHSRTLYDLSPYYSIHEPYFPCQTSNEMSNEIKNLDAELQMLVYENYSKFIRATETVNGMAHTIRTVLLPKDMAALQTSLETISDCVDRRLDTLLTAGNERIAVLLGRQKKLESVKLLLSVPTVLRDALARKDFGTAAEVYLRQSQKILGILPRRILCLLSGRFGDCGGQGKGAGEGAGGGEGTA